jgi:hypothetical protein
MYIMANPVGRPLKFKSVEDFETQAEEYFESTPKDEWTITGLAYHLNTFRNVLMDYEEKDEFSNAVKRVKLRVEMSYEGSLRKNGRAGDIFGLKNFGWKDKTEVDQNISGSLDTGIQDPATAQEFKEFLKSKTKE